ncbi:PilZ domain-containing protein [Geovibrio thiophilus]|uniref:PilZ domain-containing protein n=1 Tax=Geovibrio thiophilus TaxID=139438 RepID=A0A410JX33_9BACT|nr:PilZ domain-containing protein [Geovibrio thiophilus]QAR32724.1 PilZ domain-containing protein [Geovibrio thiophilus]
MTELQETSESVMTNRRNFIRAKVAIKMCGFFFEEGDDGSRAYSGGCFMSKTLDMSEGGMQIIHNGSLKPGDIVELRTKNAITFPKCMKCDHYYNMRSKIELQPLTVRIVWAQGSRCGLEYIRLSNFNRNVISKIVWHKHIEEIKNTKEPKQ